MSNEENKASINSIVEQLNQLANAFIEFRDSYTKPASIILQKSEITDEDMRELASLTLKRIKNLELALDCF